MKFVNTLNKPPLKLRLVIKDSAHSNNIKLVAQQWHHSILVFSLRQNDLYMVKCFTV